MLLHRGVDRQAERAGEGAGQLFPAPAQIGFAQRVVEGRPGRVTEQRRLVVGYLLPGAGQIVGHQVDVIEWRDDLRQLAVIARQESAAGAGDGQLVRQRLAAVGDGLLVQQSADLLQRGDETIHF